MKNESVDLKVRKINKVYNEGKLIGKKVIFLNNNKVGTVINTTCFGITIQFDNGKIGTNISISQLYLYEEWEKDKEKNTEKIKDNRQFLFIQIGNNKNNQYEGYIIDGNILHCKKVNPIYGYPRKNGKFIDIELNRKDIHILEKYTGQREYWRE